MAIDDQPRLGKRKKRRKKPDQEKKRQSDDARMAAFFPFREKFIERFRGDSRAAAEKLGFSDETAERLMDLTYSKVFDKTTIARVKSYVTDGPEKRAYDLFVGRMGLTRAGTDSLRAHWIGTYRYARFYTELNSVQSVRYNGCGGILEILCDENDENDIPRFRHRSENFKPKDDDDWEHSGFVFKTDGQVFFLGTAAGVMRLAVAQAVIRPASEPIFGVIVSLRSAAPYTPFGARFIMVKDDNTELLARLSDPKTGEAEFHRLTKDTQSFYMLAHN